MNLGLGRRAVYAGALAAALHSPRQCFCYETEWRWEGQPSPSPSADVNGGSMDRHEVSEQNDEKDGGADHNSPMLRHPSRVDGHDGNQQDPGTEPVRLNGFRVTTGGLSTRSGRPKSTPTLSLDALSRLYHSTDGPNWRIKKDWMSSHDPCGYIGFPGIFFPSARAVLSKPNLPTTSISHRPPSPRRSVWYGVFCGITYDDIDTIILDNNDLSGTLPTQLGHLTGIASKVCAELRGSVHFTDTCAPPIDNTRPFHHHQRTNAQHIVPRSWSYTRTISKGQFLRS